jgi:pimeloyl-ACP methyl ester carboxylesterase
MKHSIVLVFALLALTLAASAQPAATPRSFHVTVTGHGEPMILIPGLNSAGEVWDSTVAHYQQRYECHVLTLAGFAGQPPIREDLLATARKELAAYIREHHMQHPVIVGHSLGGFLALQLAIKEPDLPGRLVIVDSLPALGAAGNPVITAADMQANAGRLREGMLAASSADRLQYQKASVAAMVTAAADAERISGWGTASDPRTTADAMYDILATDLRDDVAKIKAPTLVLGTWVAYEKYATQAQILKNFQQQYKKLKGVRIELAPTARHFIMYDQPEWMLGLMDDFLSQAK